jgi:hypothetical protein
MSTPTCVQYVHWHSNANYENGNAFKFKLPNATLASNCLILCLSYAYSAGRTISITDDQSNSWPGTPTIKTDDTGNNYTTALFVLPGATAGVVTITVTFDTAIMGVHASCSEWYNVATASPLDGSSGANLVIGNPVASGSFSTAVDGDLIYHVGIDTNYGAQLDAGFQDGATGITKASGCTLLGAEIMYASFIEYQIQGTHGATNPGVTFSGGSMGSVSYNSLTVALKAATAGTAPGSGVRVFGIQHSRLKTISSGDYPIWAPLSGNTGVLCTTYPPSGTQINTVAGSVSGSWSVISTAGYPQFGHKAGMSSSDVEVLTINVTAGSSGELQYCLYDIVNGGAYDTYATANVGSFGPGNGGPLPTLTPGISSGIAVCACGFYTGPPDSLPSPSGAFFDSAYYTGYTDLAPLDSGDGYGHYYFGSNASQTWTWNDTAATSGAFATAVSFATAALAPTINTQPVGIAAYIGNSAQFTVAATTSGGTLHYQWKLNGSNVGSDSASYSRTVQAGDHGLSVQVRVTDDNGFTDSNTVAVYESRRVVAAVVSARF